MPWELPFRFGRTIGARTFVGWRRGLGMLGRHAGCWRSQRCLMAPRGEAAKIGGMDRQTLRDWVIRFNGQGPDGLINKASPGAAGKLTAEHRAFLARLVKGRADPGGARCGAMAGL